MQSLETHRGVPGLGPAFSPNGKQLAFIRTNGALTMGEIFVMPANGGEAHRLTFDNTVIPSPPTWTRDSRSIVFSSPRTSIPTLWRIPLSGGSPVQIPQVGVVAVHPSVSASGNRLTYDQIMGHSSIWSLRLDKLGKRDSRMLVTGSGGFHWAPEFSPDGGKSFFIGSTRNHGSVDLQRRWLGSGPIDQFGRGDIRRTTAMVA